MPTNFDPQFAVQVLTGIRVPMRDGVELNVKITRPSAEGRFPGIVEYNPYRRLSLACPDYRDEYPPIVPYLAERGYVVVQFEVRGTGSSSGFTTDIYSEEERRDGYDMIEWTAAQPWCTGAVGMIGKSYSAVVQWQIAVQNPPHLKTIIVRSANDDVYTEWTNPGGAMRPYMWESYAPLMNAFNFAPPDAHLTGDQFEAIWAERLENSEPWSLNWLRNLVQSPYWRSKSLAPGYGRVKCPVFVVEGWADWYFTAELRAYQNLQTPKKVWIGPWGHYYAEEKSAFPGPRVDGRREYLKWFDYWLKNIQNGVMDEPPVTIFVRRWKTPEIIYLEDEGDWRYETSWPPQAAKPTPFYFDQPGQLSPAPPEASSTNSYDYRPSVGLATGRHGRGHITPWAMPLDQRLDEAYSLVYTTEPLSSSVELLGEPEVLLEISCSADTAYFHVKLCDVAADGVSKLISDGGLLASHRNSHENPEPLEIGKPYVLRFTLKHAAYRFEEGHRIRVDIASSDFQNAWPTGKPSRNTLHCGGPNASRIILPLADPTHASLPLPKFEPPPNPQLSVDSLLKPEYAIHLDLINDTVSSEFFSPEGKPALGTNRSRFTVSNRNPAEAVIESEVIYTAPHPTLHIRVESRCTTSSDADSFTHTADVSITVDGKPRFYKKWSETAPRRYC